ncbi:dihydrofolate reductase family protein [Kitasatospora sp. NBC_00085]|uniref:dihydrofolate reductase family protein n=1 Tax=unclassified Kitasatospora TaxID=2633591 RepID=UPI00324C3B02
MRRLTYFVGTSLDGFIAGPEGQIDFFPFEGDLAAVLLAEYPETVPVQGRGPLGIDGAADRRFDTVLMGRGTYEPGLAVGVTSPYPHLTQYVFSRTLARLDPEVEIVSADPVAFVRDLKRQDGAGIWLCGGAALAGQLLEEIDELIVKRYPVVIGSGLPLFHAPFLPVGFTLTDSRVFNTGATITTYAKAPEMSLNMLFRPTDETDLDRVTAVTVDEPVSWIDADRYLEELEEGMYRPEWTWIAEDGGRIVARALWWGQASSEHPIALDCLHVDPSVADRAAVAAGLITAGLRAFAEQGATKPPLYNVTLPNGWRELPDVVAALAWRHEAALAAGLTNEVERLRLEWTPDAGLPASSGRLTFTEGSDEEFLDVFRRIAEGSLDAETRRNVASMGAEAAAREEVDFYLGCPGERSWWRLARTPDGQVAGLALPSATPYNRNVGYLGVVPELRGQGYVDDVLAEITRVQVEAGAELITATTDTGNAPMAAAFARAGYRTAQTRMIYSAPEASKASKGL